MIACEHVTVRIGPKTLLSDVSLAAAPGALCVLVGPNGAGKSTLLHVLAGDRPPTTGSVSAFGRPLSAWPPGELARRRAVLPQEATLAFPFTVIEVALLGRAPHVRFTEGEEDSAIARRAIAAVGLTHLEHRLYTTLSGGERQRAQIARVLAQLGGLESRAPRILLLDEPTSSLDPAQQHSTLRIARALARDGASVLAVLHDLNLAAQYADNIALLDQGKLRAFGPTEEVLPTLNALIDRAVVAGIEHVVFLSVEGADRQPWIPHHAVERHLMASPIAWTFLRAGFFAQNFGDAYRKSIAEAGEIVVPAGRGRVAFVDVRDLAELAVRAFDEPALRGQAWTLTGPKALSFAEAARILSEVTGRPIQYRAASVLGYLRHVRAEGAPWGQALVQTLLHGGLRFGNAESVDPALGRLLGRSPRSFVDYARDHRALFAKPEP